MSALSSAIRTRAAVFGGLTQARRGSFEGCRAPARPTASVVGSQRSASSTYGMAPTLVEAAAGRAPIRSGGRWDVPVRMVTVNVVPRPSWLVDRDAAAMQAGQLLDERQADARAFVGTGPAVLDAVEPLEHARQVGLRECRRRYRRREARRDRRAIAVRTAIRPSNVNLNAFDSRFRTIFSHISRST